MLNRSGGRANLVEQSRAEQGRAGMHGGGRNRRPGRFSACLILAVGIATARPSIVAAGSLAGQSIVIDPGHGGVDGGATAFGRVEKLVTLPIGLDLDALLRGAGARVVLTRSDDRYVSLAARSAIANAAGATVFVSIHANALSDPSYAGVTTFYGPSSGFVTGVTRSPGLVAASRTLAEDVQAAIQGRTGAINRGVQAADYYVLGNARMPAILVETGFITNPAEGQRLVNPAYQQSLAAGIADGLAQYAANSGAPVASETVPNSSAGASSTPAGRYVVRSGDTLSAIAVRFGVTESALRAANALSNIDVIFAGRTLDVPNAGSGSPPPNASGLSAASTGPVAAPGGSPSGTYTVRSGDTLSGIAVRFGTTEAALRGTNVLANSDVIYAGQTLKVSAAGPSDTTPVASSTATAPGPAGSGEPGGPTYTVQAGDTLSGIALHLGISQSAIARASGLANTDRLFAGQTLHLPGNGQTPATGQQAPVGAPSGRRYRVRASDTLSGIALRLGISENALVSANQLTDLNRLIAGQYLQLPGGN
jgi:N-acetylmuramoyl-L-alanine amidase/murein DD-endopeptidase MepM/ murein hydrolase activator NlpD